MVRSKAVLVGFLFGVLLVPLMAQVQIGRWARIVGTPANNQVAIWTNATTLEGAAGFTFDGTNITAGVWQATAIAAGYGGTGLDTSGSTGVAQVAAGTWSVGTTLQSAVQDNITRLGTLTSGPGGFTAGSVLFSDGTTLAQDNANLFWDSANKRLGIGENVPLWALHLKAAGIAYSAIERTTPSALVRNYINDSGNYVINVKSGAAASVDAVTITSSGGFVGIGENALNPLSVLHVIQSAVSQLIFDSYGSPGRAIQSLRVSRGTFSSPSNVSSGDAIGELTGSGYAGGAFRNVASVSMAVGTGSIGAGSLPAYVYIETTPAGSATRVEVSRFDQAGNVLVGTTASPSTGTKGLVFGDGTGLSSMGTNTAGLYADDVAGTVEMFAIDEAGNNPQLTPHNFSLYSPQVGEEYPYGFYQRNRYLGVEMAVDTIQLARLVQQLTGVQLIYRRDLPDRRDWVDDQEVNMRQAMAAYTVWEQRRDAFEPSGGEPTFTEPPPSVPVLKRPPQWLEDRLRTRGWLNATKAQALTQELAAWKAARGIS